MGWADGGALLILGGPVAQGQSQHQGGPCAGVSPSHPLPGAPLAEVRKQACRSLSGSCPHLRGHWSPEWSRVTGGPQPAQAALRGNPPVQTPLQLVPRKWAEGTW